MFLVILSEIILHLRRFLWVSFVSEERMPVRTLEVGRGFRHCVFGEWQKQFSRGARASLSTIKTEVTFLLHQPALRKQERLRSFQVSIALRYFNFKSSYFFTNYWCRMSLTLESFKMTHTKHTIKLSEGRNYNCVLWWRTTSTRQYLYADTPDTSITFCFLHDCLIWIDHQPIYVTC